MAEFIDTKIDLILNHLSRARYEDLLSSDRLSANELYLVDEEYIDGLSTQIVNVANPILSSDAANKAYVDAEDEELSDLAMMIHWYPDGSVSDKSQWTELNYEFNDTDHTATVLAFNDSAGNLSVSGDVIIPPYVIHNGEKYSVATIFGTSNPINNSGLRSIKAPTTISSISKNSFTNCISLLNASFPNVTYCGNTAFQNCIQLSSVFIPKVNSLDNVGIFIDCTSLKYIFLPNTEHIQEWFTNCSSLEYVYIPSVQGFSLETFDGCSSLDVIDFGKTTKTEIPTFEETGGGDISETVKFIIPDDNYEDWIVAYGWADLYNYGFQFIKASNWEYARKIDILNINVPTATISSLGIVKPDGTSLSVNSNGTLNVITSAFVPSTRTINGKALSSDIALTAGDLSAVSIDNAQISNGLSVLAYDWPFFSTSIGDSGPTLALDAAGVFYVKIDTNAISVNGPLHSSPVIATWPLSSGRLIVDTELSNYMPSVATSATVGLVKPDNNTITIDANGTLSANTTLSILSSDEYSEWMTTYCSPCINIENIAYNGSWIVSGTYTGVQERYDDSQIVWPEAGTPFSNNTGITNQSALEIHDDGTSPLYTFYLTRRVSVVSSYVLGNQTDKPLAPAEIIDTFNSRKINGKALSSDITLTAADVSAVSINVPTPVLSSDAVNKAYVDVLLDKSLSAKADLSSLSSKADLTSLTENYLPLDAGSEHRLQNDLWFDGYGIVFSDAPFFKIESGDDTFDFIEGNKTIPLDFNAGNGRIALMSDVSAKANVSVLNDYVLTSTNNALSTKVNEIENSLSSNYVAANISQTFTDLQKDQIGLNAGARYKLICQELIQTVLSGNTVLSCLLNDYTVNTVSISSDEYPIVLQLPASSPDLRARDFLLRLEITASEVPEITIKYPEGENIDFESIDDNWTDFSPGVNFISFTETKNGLIR